MAVDDIFVYEGTEPYIFISYAHKDAEVVLPILKALADNHFRIWYDKGINSGNNYKEVIGDRLDNCACVVFFVSYNSTRAKTEDSNESFCLREISVASDKHKQIHPVYLTNGIEISTALKIDLYNAHALYYTNYNNNIESLLTDLTKDKLMQSCREGATADLTEPCFRKGEQYGEMDPAEALNWLYQAAEKGNAEAQYQLGVCYLDGRGTEKDESKACFYFQESANQGNARAQVKLGKFYEIGAGGNSNPDLNPEYPHECLIDLEEAAKWYMEAEKQNDAEGCYNLGRCYEQGIGLPADSIKARRCYNRAAIKGHEEAKVALLMMDLRGISLSNANYTVAIKMLGELTQTIPSAKTALGICYQNGHGICPDILEAVRLYTEAAEQGDARAKYMLANCYEQGIGVAPDLCKYHQLLHEAAELGLLEAAFTIQFNPQTWQSNDQNYAFAQWWLADSMPDEWFDDEKFELNKKAYENGCPEAAYALAKCYEDGVGVKPDFNQALKLYEQAANYSGDAKAMLRLAEYYEDVACGEVHDVEYSFEGDEMRAMHDAKKWYELSARCGNAIAQKWLIMNSAPKESENWRTYAIKCGNTDLED